MKFRESFDRTPELIHELIEDLLPVVYKKLPIPFIKIKLDLD